MGHDISAAFVFIKPRIELYDYSSLGFPYRLNHGQRRLGSSHSMMYSYMGSLAPNLGKSMVMTSMSLKPAFLYSGCPASDDSRYAGMPRRTASCMPQVI